MRTFGIACLVDYEMLGSRELTFAMVDLGCLSKISMVNWRQQSGEKAWWSCREMNHANVLEGFM
eukprot:360865-Amorphochlora_amoeboformis.AAC.2